MMVEEIKAKIYSTNIDQWRPNPGMQTVVLSRQEKEVLVGGSRGPGKTEVAIVWLAEDKYIQNSDYKALIIRKNYDDLSDFIERIRTFYKPLGAKFSGNPPIIRFPSGAFMRTGHMKDETAYEKYVGHEYQKILIEELTQIPRESQYEKLLGSCRSTVEGLSAQLMATTNPGGVGHVWVRDRWVKKAYKKTYFYGKKKNLTRIFIPGTIEDNPILMKIDPAYIDMIENIKDEKLRRAWRYGDWDTFSGQFFEMWDEDVHVIDGFEIPKEWSKFRGLDWGHRSPSCVLWCAVDFLGNHYLYRELYEANLVPEQLARKTLLMTPPGEEILATVADPSIWAKSQYGIGRNKEQATVKSIQQKIEEEGLFLLKANNDRISGWENFRQLLYHDKNYQPKLKIFRNCENFIRTVPYMVHDEKKVEDLNTESEDHPADTGRYLFMHTSQSYMGEPVKSEREKFWDELEYDFKEEVPWGVGL